MRPDTLSRFCAVCGEQSICGKHYSAICCDGCRSFFKRSIRRNMKYVCKESNSCVIDVLRRNQCQACRFRKSLEVGMNKHAVQNERPVALKRPLNITQGVSAAKTEVEPNRESSQPLISYIQMIIQLLSQFCPLNILDQSDKRKLIQNSWHQLFLVHYSYRISRVHEETNEQVMKLIQDLRALELTYVEQWLLSVSIICKHDIQDVSNTTAITMARQQNLLCLSESVFSNTTQTIEQKKGRLMMIFMSMLALTNIHPHTVKSHFFPTATHDDISILWAI